MKRVCLYVTYDCENIVDASIGYMLKELRKVTDRIIVICNYGYISEGIENVQPYVDTILYRENRGFDGGAYKEALEQITDIESFDEMILSNDTFFGPFIPFDKIFDKMDNVSCDFWGLNRRHIPMYDFTASFFVVFRKPALAVAVEYIKNTISKDMSRDQILELFEQGISYELNRRGFRMGTYCDIAAVDRYREALLLTEVLCRGKLQKSPAIYSARDRV